MNHIILSLHATSLLHVPTLHVTCILFNAAQPLFVNSLGELRALERILSGRVFPVYVMTVYVHIHVYNKQLRVDVL